MPDTHGNRTASEPTVSVSACSSAPGAVVITIDDTHCDISDKFVPEGFYVLDAVLVRMSEADNCTSVFASLEHMGAIAELLGDRIASMCYKVIVMLGWAIETNASEVPSETVSFSLSCPLTADLEAEIYLGFVSCKMTAQLAPRS